MSRANLPVLSCLRNAGNGGADPSSLTPAMACSSVSLPSTCTSIDVASETAVEDRALSRDLERREELGDKEGKRSECFLRGAGLALRSLDESSPFTPCLAALRRSARKGCSVIMYLG